MGSKTCDRNSHEAAASQVFADHSARAVTADTGFEGHGLVVGGACEGLSD
ncbi:hypothetical protein JG688_00007597 [Phytophthora aleatoria]|uniref:Uncharacterized protein n=1 Tax=Phytophthora aleatoria TaxID=2496075 RepID=A0A8J5MG73_9STRA|nr:hypothetical protein JG688_00007597 [Phytophthora aleatoria]